MKRMLLMLLLCSGMLFACGNQSDTLNSYTKDANIKEEKQEETEKEEIQKEEETTNKENQTEIEEKTSQDVTQSTKNEVPSTSNKNTTSTDVIPPLVAKEEPLVSERVSKVSISIDAKTLLNNMDKVAANKQAYVPSDGWILAPITVEIKEGDSVFDVLSRVTRERRIHMEYQGANQNLYNSVYIQGINQLYEFDCGELSGWMYTINGAYVAKGASGVKVEDGMKIEWRYTCDLGRDLGL